MARPSKNNADFFGHDAGMRNHRKIKAIRAKFGLSGYAIWVMFLEVLTESNDNRFIDNDLELELLAGDFDVSVTETREVLDYCVRLELLFSDGGKIYSKTLDEKLKAVYEKRDLARKNYEKKSGSKIITTPKTVSVTETTQSKGKVNETKVNEGLGEKKEDYDDNMPDFVNDELNDLKSQIKIGEGVKINWVEFQESLIKPSEMKNTARKNNSLNEDQYLEAVERFIGDQRAIDKPVKSEADVRAHFLFWIPKWIEKKEKIKPITQSNAHRTYLNDKYSQN